MVRSWSIEKKQGLLQRLVKAMLAPETPTLSCLKLLKGLIKDQSERSPYGYHSQGNSYMTGGMGTYPPTGSAGTGALRNRNGQQAQGAESPEADEEDAKEQPPEEVLTLQVVLSQLQKDPGLVDGLLQDLTGYYERAAKYLKETAADQATERRKIFVAGSLYAHHDEIDERL